MGLWNFPKQSKGSGGDGVLGRNSISTAHKVSVAGASDDAALHVNFVIVPTALRRPTDEDGRSSMTFQVSKFHMTARSAANQQDIVDDGPSILTAAKSIHCGPNNDWNWTKVNATALATEIGATIPNLQTALSPFGMTYTGAQRAPCEERIVKSARNRDVDATVEAGDRTWS